MDILHHITDMEILIHIANIFLLISFSVKSMLQLRALNMVAGGFFITHFLILIDQPIWSVVAWNSLFMCVNIWRIWLAILERRVPVLSAEEQHVQHVAFSDLDQRSFRKLLDLGQWENGVPPDILVQSGHTPERVWILTEGKIEVRRADTVIRSIDVGDFIGETSFLTQKPMPADIVICENVRCLSWATTDLEAFMSDHPEIASTIQKILGRCLAKKLQAA